MTTAGFPHSDIHGSKPACGSPWLFAANHVLHRLLVPRHPPYALISLILTDPPYIICMSSRPLKLQQIVKMVNSLPLSFSTSFNVFFSAICFPICFRIWPYAVFKVLRNALQGFPLLRFPIFNDALASSNHVLCRHPSPLPKKSSRFLSGY